MASLRVSVGPCSWRLSRGIFRSVESASCALSCAASETVWPTLRLPVTFFLQVHAQAEAVGRTSCKETSRRRRHLLLCSLFSVSGQSHDKKMPHHATLLSWRLLCGSSAGLVRRGS